ncbi:MAG TPA: hypothetical protein VNJ51_08680 [Candidatus Dormibacteraeota bacterium]|nr:hypothetical protein [Candidatus Dormibacteraeota bacterium]
MPKAVHLLAAVLVAGTLLAACSRAPQRTAQSTASPVPSVAPIATPTPTRTPAPTPSPTPAPTPSPTPAPTPSPTPAPTPSPTPTPTPTPTPHRIYEIIATPRPSPTLAPAAALDHHPRVIAVSVHQVRRAPVHPEHVEPVWDRYAGRLAAPTDPPKIFSVEISDDTPGSGETVSGKVVTTTNVAAVTARIATFSIGLDRKDYGVFTLTYTVPHLPFFLKGGYTMVVTAITPDGRTVSTDLPITVH